MNCKKNRAVEEQEREKKRIKNIYKAKCENIAKREKEREILKKDEMWRLKQPPATLSAAPPSLRPSPSTAILPLDIRSLSQLQRSLSCLVNYAVEFAHTRVARMILMRCQVKMTLD